MQENRTDTHRSGVIKTILKRWVRPSLYPLVRFMVRYSPSWGLRRVVWQRIVDPYFQGRHQFVARTVVGCKIGGDTEDMIQRYVYFFGIWEPNLTHWVGWRLKEGDVFVDIGANIGYYTLLASRLVGKTGRVIAIEVSPTTFRQLTKNVQRSGAANIELLNIAVSDVLGKLKVYRAPSGNIGKTGVFQRDGFMYEAEVEAAPLSKLISPGTMRRVRLIKIDVEGSEGAVITGMEPLLEFACNDLKLVVEFWPESLRAGGWDPDELINKFSRRGFHIYQLENDYAPQSYLSHEQPKLPARIRQPIAAQTDLVFSRVNAETL